VNKYVGSQLYFLTKSRPQQPIHYLAPIRFAYMSLSPSTVVSQSFPIDSFLTRILGGRAFKWEAEKSTGFTEWWENTDWAAKLRDNLAKDVQGRSNISPP